ncbi:glycoside hydrolase family 97 protein, partial [Pseudoxanthomonas sp. SGD-10]
MMIKLRYTYTFKTILFFCFLVVSGFLSHAEEIVATSPDKQLTVKINTEDGLPNFSVFFKNKTMLEKSPLGIITNEGDFSKGMKLLKSDAGHVSHEYTQDKIKRSEITYQANTIKCIFENADKKQISVLFQISNNDIAFRYELPTWGERVVCVVEKETTGFRFPSHTRTFLSPMMTPMVGFARTAPSYESGYEADAPLEKSTSREGYVFPGLFKIGNDGWVLLSETGVSSLYCASHLSSWKNGVYTVEYPNIKQNNGFGSSSAQIGLPGKTPWRTITVGDNLKPIVETTIAFDVVEPLYE